MSTVVGVECARSPYGESTFKRNRPSFAVLMVLGGGGGGEGGGEDFANIACNILYINNLHEAYLYLLLDNYSYHSNLKLI